MTASRSLAVMLLAAAMLPGCALMRSDPADTRAAIEAVNARFSEAFGKGDVEAVAALYTEDGTLLPPGAAPVKGRAAIAGFWKGARASGVKGVMLMTDSVEVSGDLAYETGTAQLMIQPRRGKATIGHAKYLVVWKKEAGEWRLHRDIWNDGPKKK
jgi:uncharacterized protein (TIGR02246 family)